MKKDSETTVKMLEYIDSHIKLYGISPTYRDVQANFKISSASVVAHHLRNHKDKMKHKPDSKIYSRKDLVSFANYMLSLERDGLLKYQVSHANFENWLSEPKVKNEIQNL